MFIFSHRAHTPGRPSHFTWTIYQPRHARVRGLRSQGPTFRERQVKHPSILVSTIGRRLCQLQEHSNHSMVFPGILKAWTTNVIDIPRQFSLTHPDLEYLMLSMRVPVEEAYMSQHTCEGGTFRATTLLECSAAFDIAP
jgi:hypothetical protein